MVKIGIEFLPVVIPQKCVEWIKLAENAGFEHAWIADHYPNRNAYEVLVASALNTKKIFLGIGVTNPYIINPAWTASAIATLNELSEGRAILGLGPGDRTTLGSLAIPIKMPLTTIKESVSIIRKLWLGEGVDFTGKVFSFRGAKLNYTATVIPIYIGAQGPMMLKLAGEIGDGVLINASHPTDFKVAIKQIKEGAESAGRDLKRIDVAAWTCFSIDPEDAEKARRKAVEIVAFIVASCPPEILERHGIEPIEAKKIGEALLKRNFKDAFELVTDSMVDSFSISGKPERCLKKINELISMGVTQLIIGSPYGTGTKREAIELISTEIIGKV